MSREEFRPDYNLLCFEPGYTRDAVGAFKVAKIGWICLKIKTFPASLWYQRLLEVEIKLKYQGLRDSDMDWMMNLEREIAATCHLTYLRLQSSTCWGSGKGETINITHTTRPLTLRHEPEQLFKLGFQNINDYFLLNLFRLDLFHTPFGCGQLASGKSHHPLVLSKVHLMSGKWLKLFMDKYKSRGGVCQGSENSQNL